MKLTINREYFRNHLFVTILMAGLGLWFAYDGFVRYPSTPAAALYESIENVKPPENVDLEAFKTQKIQTQYGFTFFALAASFIVGFRLLQSARFNFSFDDAGFQFEQKKFSYEDISSVDDRAWEKKSITRICVGPHTITLDAWHHVGVKEFHDKIKNRQA